MTGDKNERPLLSIVIANYNYGKYLPAAIESIIQQCEAPRAIGGRKLLPIKGSDRSVELLICDAASSDDSVAVIKKYENYISWWCSEKDSGQSEAFNKGFRRANGEWLTWLNADEEYLPGTFLALSKKIKRCPSARWITGNMMMFDIATRTVTYVTWGPHHQPAFLKRNHACLDVFGPTSFFRKDLYEKIGPINERFHYSMDLEYWARLLMAGVCQARLNHVCWAFGLQSDSKSAGSISADALEKGHAENVERETRLGYTYEARFKNPWYCLWILMRILDGSLWVRWYKQRKIIGSVFPGVLNQKAANRRLPNLYQDRRTEGKTLLRQCQLVELHLLHVFAAICRRHNLKFFLCGGTLLGALRHNGFIPWDDDIDVAMPMKDFKKFLKLAREELPEDVSLQAPGDDPRSGYRFAKLRDEYSFFYESLSRVSCKSANGIFMDIFPYENSPRIPEGLRKWIGWIVSSAYEHELDNVFCMTNGRLLLIPWYLLKATFFWWLHASMRVFWWLLQHLLPCDKVCPILEFWDRANCWPKERIRVLVGHEFEGETFPIPQNADKCLDMQYGDWRVKPSVEKQTCHMSFVDPFKSAEGRRYPLSRGGGGVNESCH